MMKMSNEKPRTIGEVSDEMAENYFNMYQSLKQRMSQEEAEAFAKHDIRVNQITFEFALEKLTKKIKESRGASK